MARTRNREVIERFRSGEAPVFLISLKAGGRARPTADYVFAREAIDRARTKSDEEGECLSGCRWMIEAKAVLQVKRAHENEPRPLCLVVTVVAI